MKTVLITGGAKRLGRALVEEYAKKGYQVLFTTKLSFEEGVLLANKLGKNVHCTRGSITTRIEAASIAKWVGNYTESLNLIVCNASSFKKLSIAETMQSDMDDLLGSNFIGPYFLAQQCLDFLKKCNGSIVNIADAQVNSGLPNFSAYLAAKAGLVSITKSLALEFSPQVRVNAVLPGTLPWPDEVYSEDEMYLIKKEIPLKRTGEWSDIVSAVGYLEESKFVNGACLPVDGGRSQVY